MREVCVYPGQKVSRSVLVDVTFTNPTYFTDQALQNLGVERTRVMWKVEELAKVKEESSYLIRRQEEKIGDLKKKLKKLKKGKSSELMKN